MCGRFSQGAPSRRISDDFGAYPDDDLPDGLYNVPPTERIRMVVQRDGERRLASARWGFEPFWADAGDAPARSWINVRAERAFESPAFGPALRARRCVIPAEAFYEWDRNVIPRQPYAIGPAEGGFLALAGIWTDARGGHATAAILTTTPNSTVAPIHHRMPVTLPHVVLDAWLDPQAPLDDIALMLGPATAESVRLWAVSPEVNRVATDGAHLLNPVEPPRTLGLA